MAEEKKLQVFPVGITEKEIKKIADQAIADSGAANEVPLATIADAGKVIKVGDDGKYELGEASGGGAKLYSHCLTSSMSGAWVKLWIINTDPTPIGIKWKNYSYNFTVGDREINPYTLETESVNLYCEKYSYLYPFVKAEGSGTDPFKVSYAKPASITIGEDSYSLLKVEEESFCSKDNAETEVSDTVAEL